MDKIPVLFIGHGSPMNINQKNSFTKDLKELGKKLPIPDAILVISAHFLTNGTYITCESQPKQIYDFYGFPAKLYEFQYHPAGAPVIAKKICSLFKNGLVECTNKWGLDHAAYMILGHIFPNANIPTIELSLDYYQKPQYHYDLAKNLKPLRDQNILIIGSGNLIHTFRYIDPDQFCEPFSWAIEYDSIQKENLIHRNIVNLIHYEQYELSAKAFQTNEHYLPMLYTIALQEEEENIKFFHESFQHGSISHRSFQIG